MQGHDHDHLGDDDTTHFRRAVEKVTLPTDPIYLLTYSLKTPALIIACDNNAE